MNTNEPHPFMKTMHKLADLVGTNLNKNPKKPDYVFVIACVDVSENADEEFPIVFETNMKSVALIDVLETLTESIIETERMAPGNDTRN